MIHTWHLLFLWRWSKTTLNFVSCFLIVCWLNIQCFTFLYFCKVFSSLHPSPHLCILLQQFFSFLPSCLPLVPQSAPVLSVYHHSQKMLVMSESRLKIQITSGAEIRTNDQDTSFMDWRSLIIMAPTIPTLALVLCSSASSSSNLMNDKGNGETLTRVKQPMLVLTEELSHKSPYLELASWFNVVAGQEFESFIHQDDRNGHL